MRGCSVLYIPALVAIALFSIPVDAFELTSPAFEANALMPVRFTCDGEDFSPPLVWQTPAGNVKSYALICDDPDAPVGNWVHWVMYNIPAGRTRLAQGLAKKGSLEGGIKQGRNDFGRTGYGGPCPPPGPAHRYFFKLFALNTVLTLENPTKSRLEKAMAGHIVAQAELVGRYRRKK